MNINVTTNQYSVVLLKDKDFDLLKVQDFRQSTDSCCETRVFAIGKDITALIVNEGGEPLVFKGYTSKDFKKNYLSAIRTVEGDVVYEYKKS